MSATILQTKLYIPPERPNLISRPRLLAKLPAGGGSGGPFSRRLTLISAPAGFGKSTLITNWIHQQERPHTAFGWLSLDENDNNLVGFLIYLVSAVQKALQGTEDSFGTALLAGLQSARPPEAEALLPA
jgi:LuxR family maltose regulon positive regulatory protein